MNWQQELAKLQRHEDLFRRTTERSETRRYQFGDPARHIEFEAEKSRKALVVRAIRERGKSMNDQELHAYCEAWRQWGMTRKFFIAPGAKSILGQMQPSKIGTVPDAPMSEDLSFFNMAIHTLADMREPGAKCFIDFYWHRVRNIKVEAAKMGITRKTFYERKMRFARAALSMSVSLRNMHAMGRAKEPEAAAVID
jgi:hypothetical protein